MGNNFNVSDSVPATPSDTVDESNAFTGFIVMGSAGAVKVGFSDGTTRTYPAVLAGTLLPITGSAVRIYVTGTTATNIVLFV
jgi:hypothetical protein